MTSLHVFTLVHFILTVALKSSGLMSDYKKCGDNACARLMCRVQAVRDHPAQDCRFLSFKKGDMIDVYHKLTRKRSNLWAGSTEKQFGYFLKNAVKIDEVFVDEKQEIEMSTQKTDFFCMDAFGTVIASDEGFEDYEFGDQTAESGELGNSDFDDRASKASETNDNIETRHFDNVNKVRGKQGQSGSSWIGSAVSGWFANDADETGNGNKEQEKFNSRKLALDLDQLDKEERQTEIFDSIGGELTNTEHDEDLPNEQSSYFLGYGIKNILGFGGGEDTSPSENKKLNQDENMQNVKEQQEATSLKLKDSSELITENEKSVEKKDAGWYDSVYNRITNIYGDKGKGKESLADQGMDVDKVRISKDQKSPEPKSESFPITDSPSDRNRANQDKKQEGRSQDELTEMTESSQVTEGWYGSVYNRLTGFYGDIPDDIIDVIENGRGDPHVSSEPEDLFEDVPKDVRSSQGKKLENSDHTAEKVNENINAEWYDSVYSRIRNIYGDTSDKHEVADVKKDVESQTQSENTKDMSSPSIFTMNGLSSMIDGLRLPSKEGLSDDESTLSESIASEQSLMQSHVSTDKRVAMTLSDDNDNSQDPELTNNHMDTDQNQYTSQSIFPINHLSMTIKGLKTQFKPSDAGDAEESHGEKTSDTGKDGQSDNNDESDNDDELSAKMTDVIREISTQRAALSSEQEEEAVQEVKVAKAHSSLECNKQDMGGDGENMYTDINKSSNDINVDKYEVSDQPDSDSVRLSTGHSNMTAVLNTGETEMLTEKLGWNELAEHLSDTPIIPEGDANKNDVNKSIPEKDQSTDIPGEEDPRSESETGSDSGLQVKIDVIEDNSEIADVQNKAEDADVLPETEEAGMKVRGSEVAQMESNNEKHSVDASQMEHGGEKECGDATQIEYGGENKSVNIILMEYDEEKEGGDIIKMEHHGKKKVVDVKEGGVTQVEYSGRQEDVAQMESGGEKESLDITQVDNIRGKDALDTTPMESGGDNRSGEFTQVKNAGEKEGVEITRIVTDGEKESVNITQTEYGGEKEGIDFQKEQLSLHSHAQGLENTQSISVTKQDPVYDPDPHDSRESEKWESAAAKQAEITPKNVQDKTDGYEAEISSTSDGDQNEHVRKRNGNKMLDVEYNKAHPSAQTQKCTYPNLKAHINEEDIHDLLNFFSGETLSWLDFIVGHSEYINNKELAELHDFEQTLQHLLKTRNQEITLSLQSIQTVLAMLRKKFISVIADGSVDKIPDPSQTECVSETCVSTTKNTPISEKDMGKDNNMDQNMDSKMDNSSSVKDSDSLISKSLSNDQEFVTEKSRIVDESDQKTAPPDTNIITEDFVEPENSPNEGVLHPYTALVAEFKSDVFMYMAKKSAHVKQAMLEVVMSLPDDIRPGPDLYGLPWEAVIFTAALGLFTFLLFTCRFIQAIKSRLYCRKERRMGQKVAELLEEKCKVLETLSECEHKFKKLETALQNGGLSAQDSEREDLEAMSKKLEEANAQMKSDMERMHEQLNTQDQLRKQQEEQLTKLEEMLKKLEEEATERKSQLEQDQTTLKIHKMNTERLQKKLQEAREENSMLLESKAQLEQEAEGWKERLSELEEEKRMSETSHNRMMENCMNKDERIKSLTDCLLKMRDWDSEEESSVNDTSGPETKNSSEFRQKQKVQKLINAAKMSADLKAMEEDKDRVFAKLTDEIKAKEDLQESLEQLQHEKESLEAESSMYSSEIEKLQHKLQIMSEMYQEKELKLHRMLTVEEKERSQKEEQLSKAGKKISMATDELNSYRQRAKELEEELEKTNQAYRNQIAAHEKKAHDNWLAARAVDRDLADIKRENSVLRQRLTDWQFKLELMEKNPQARAPHFRGSPFGPSPLGRPPSETRPFLSPPTLMDGPPRVSPQFPMMPGGRAPPGGVEGDRSASYSEGGSPTWERERERERERRSLGPPGPDPGLMYRRPLSAPFLRAPLPPEAYYNEKSDSSFGGDGAGFRENGIRDSGRPVPGADIRPGPLPPPPFPPVDPRDPHFPRRGYRPDFFPPPPLAMRGPPPPLPLGVFPRIPLPISQSHMAFPPMRPPADHVSPEPPSRPSPPGSEQPPEQPPSAHDVI